MREPITNEQLSRISSELVRLKAQHYGKGPTETKTYQNDSWLFCVMRGGFTKVEETLIGAGDEALVRQVRLRFQDQMSIIFRDTVEKVTGRNVVNYQSQVLVNPDYSVEIFLLEDGDSLEATTPPTGGGNNI